MYITCSISYEQELLQPNPINMHCSTRSVLPPFTNRWHCSIVVSLNCQFALNGLLLVVASLWLQQCPAYHLRTGVMGSGYLACQEWSVKRLQSKRVDISITLSLAPETHCHDGASMAVWWVSCPQTHPGGSVVPGTLSGCLQQAFTYVLLLYSFVKH